MHEGAPIMTRFANRKHVCGTASAASLAVCLALAVAASDKAFGEGASQAPAAAPAQLAPAATGRRRTDGRRANNAATVYARLPAGLFASTENLVGRFARGV
jgi:hypothetical protein